MANNEPKAPAMDRLTGQLYQLPVIIGRMGLSIANAQKAFNVDYVENVQKIMGMVDHMLAAPAAAPDAAADPADPADPGATPPAGDPPADDEDRSAAEDQRLAIFLKLIEALAPSRYQFSEATIDFSADLSETFDVAGQAGLGVGLSALTVNAALTMGYGYDYRAAARITAKLHATHADPQLARSLIERAKEIHADKLDLPKLSEVEANIWNGVGKVYAALTNRPVAPVGKDAAGGAT